MKNLDAKDYAILRELDSDFRQSFTKIGKKVGLSKNSVALRFDKLKQLMLHNIVGINNDILGYTMVKVFYSLDFLNENIEKEIIKEIKKNKNILWAARFYGHYNFGIAILVENIDDLILQLNRFNQKFAKKINEKEIQIIYEQFYFRNNFIHKKPINKIYRIAKTNKKYTLSNIEKKILLAVRYNPRMNIIDISKKTKLAPKTISKNLKLLKNNKVITGYFMTLNPIKFGFNTFKLLIQVNNSKRNEEFEAYLSSLKNVKYITKMIGMWDYEVDCVYSSITDLQEQIELIKEKFPRLSKKIEIISFGKRIVTNKEDFLRH